MIVLIPAYEPDARLLHLLDELHEAAPDAGIVVVDDGSGAGYRGVFGAAALRGATVLTHPDNRGKGRALRTGFRHVLATHPDQPVVCADCDGQHTAADVIRVGERTTASGAMTLGARQFAAGVPLRSRLGNRASRALLGWVTGRGLRDAQTGLRAYPATLLPWLLTTPGDRFEYELALLLRAAREGMPIEEIPISTVYLDRNSSSHFRPVVDSLRVMAPLVAFAASSFGAFCLDTAALLILSGLTGVLWVSVLGARALSSSVNFVVNRWILGGRGRPLGTQAARYWALAGGLLLANVASMATLTAAGLPLLLAKVVTEAALFLTSYEVQRRVVFARRTPAAGSPASAPVAAPVPAAAPKRSGGPAPAVSA